MAGDIPPGNYNLQFGSSFTDNKKNSTKYHSLRYDFKPKSVSNNTDTFIAIGNGDVHVTVPTEGDNMTVYKGSKKDAKPKECLLFFDKTTGTVRLEKISSNINVKQTRDLDKATENILRSEMAKLKTVAPSSQFTSSKDDTSSSSSSDSDSESNKSDEEPNTSSTARQRNSSNSSMDDMEHQLLSAVNDHKPMHYSSMVDDMPNLNAQPHSRPVSSINSMPIPVGQRNSHDRLGLNLSESSDSDDD